MGVTLARRWVARVTGWLRRQGTLVLAAVTGVLVGAGVAAFEWVSRMQLFDRLLEQPLAVQACAMTAGLAAATLALRYVGEGASPSTSDEYIRNFHDPSRPLDLRPVPARLLAGAATLGSGGALGYEGPSLYLGAAVGTAVQSWRPKWFARVEGKALMLAGAAAGVAAIFKAPATGAIFALEVPYRDDTARHMLLPALVGAASGYLAFVGLLGTAPLFEVAGSPPFDLRELGGAAVLGVMCGLGARGYATLLARVKQTAERMSAWPRILGAGAVLAGLLVTSDVVVGEGLSSGSGYRTLEWVTEPRHSFGLVVALLAIRTAATTATVAGGGVGGLFVPLVIAGALVGEAGAVLVGDETNLFPLIGVAAFLGAGYRTPLAGVVFVAEATGRPGFVVPGLIASVASQLVMGDVSVSPYQRAGQRRLDHRLTLPLDAVVRADVPRVAASATLREVLEQLPVGTAHVPVVDDGRYLGIVSRSDLGTRALDGGSVTPVGEVVDPSWPAARPDWTLDRALHEMGQADVELLPVVDAEGGFVGIVTSADILRLDGILGGFAEDP